MCTFSAARKPGLANQLLRPFRIQPGEEQSSANHIGNIPMNTIRLVPFLSVTVVQLSILATLQGSQVLSSAGTAANQLSWVATPLDLNSTSHRATETATTANNEVVTKVHNFTTVGIGLNYLDE